jgi:hypothetical protein
LELQSSQSGEMRNRPPWSASRIAAKTLGESKRGAAIPVDRPVGADERDCVQVAD